MCTAVLVPNIVESNKYRFIALSTFIGLRFPTKTSSEEEAEKLVADTGTEEEADARHVAQKAADCTLNEHEPLPARNCRESCLRARHLQMRCKKKSRSARKNASKVKFQTAGFVDMGR
jgi:hypothetical protein